jgi:DNA-binding response OmpR family regulator
MEKVTETKPLRNRTILIIEDDHFISRIYNKGLTAAGASVLVATDGAQGLRILDESPIDLVLLDLGMPGMNGYDTLTEIRKKPNLQTLPVIILSNTTMSEDREGYEDIRNAGVKDVLRKYETSLAEIVERISSYLPQAAAEQQ